jgi:decaprenylphospho-beta-D-ribofuranose 2-oxidase
VPSAPTLELLQGWGMVSSGRSWVYRPRSVEECAEALLDGERRGLSIAHRGAGQSYGDAALNDDGAVVELARLDHILEFDPDRGLVRAQAGVTIRQLWEHVLPHGWWPPVVPGTMAPTVGGCVAMNVHGKNAARVGTIGHHVVALTLLGPGGAVTQLSADRDPARLKTVIGAQGLNGTILDATLRLTRVHSGYLEVRPVPVRSLEEALAELETGVPASDYAVGWLDALPRGSALGRGLLHFARYLPADHRLSGAGLDVASQRLPARIAGVFPNDQVWRLLRLVTNDPGVRVVNVGRYVTGRLSRRPFTQSHAAFHFLLDYVPGWKRAYGPHGLLQYQFFVSGDAALHAFRAALLAQRRHGVTSYLAVVKRHRADDFAGSYSVDGFSLALDFPVRPRRLDRLLALCRDFDAIQGEVGGRIYAAKDAVSHGRLPDIRHPLFSSNLVRRWERA